MLSLTEHNSAVQTLENAKGKNKINSFLPWKSERETRFLSLSYKLKGGACCPVAAAIEID